MDANLTWRNHVVNVGAKLARSIFALNRVKHILPSDILRTLYFSLVQSHIMYGLIVWGNTCFVNKIFLLQKRAIRIINNKSFWSNTDPLFKNNNNNLTTRLSSIPKYLELLC